MLFRRVTPGNNPPVLNPLQCYELCVQSPRHVVNFLHALHGHVPRVLREDFCGTAAVSRRWVRDGLNDGDDRRAICIDLDPAALAYARDAARDADIPCREWSNSAPRPPGRCEIVLARGDCVGKDAPLASEGCDAIFVGNFSIGYIHRRTDLCAYLRRSLDRLRRGNAGFGGGVFVCDTYGGAGAFRLGGIRRRHVSPGREVVLYEWVHEKADALTSMVENSISLRVEEDGQIVQEYPRAFTYRWRLWSIAELREAMSEVGFTSTSVYSEINVAPGETPQAVGEGELGEDWTVCVAARA